MGGIIGDEWFIPATNQLYKLLMVNNTPVWTEIPNSNAQGGLSMPSGTTGQRPTTATTGQLRFNTDISGIEVFLNNAAWVPVVTSSYTISYLVVAGGGSGGLGGGGGGGGVLYSSTPLTVLSGRSFLITVGAGGAQQYVAGVTFNINGNGGNSSISSSFVNTTAIGGGGGGASYTGNGGGPVAISGTSYKGSYGGSGGGSGGNSSTGQTTPGAAGVYPGSSYLSQARQGYDGGACPGAGGSPSGGGGGAGGAGQAGDAGQAGGVGIANPITGSTVGQLVSTTYYVGGGGGGGSYNAGVGTGGNGGGGAGTNGGNTSGSGTPNTGGGGGGNCGGGTSGAGGSGVVVISYSNPTQIGTGGSVVYSTTTGTTTTWYHVFTSSGVFTS